MSVTPNRGTFDVGSLYSNEEIYRSLLVGNAGGIRARVASSGAVERLVVMTSVPSARQLRENPYHDRLEGDVLIYTGAGRAGSQSVTGPNARIIEQLSDPFPIYGFILTGNRRDPTIGKKRWAFLGLLECLRFFRERQMDAEGEWRDAWVFELNIHSEPKTIEVAVDRAISMDMLANRQQPLAPDDREVVDSAPRVPESINFSAIEATRKRLLGVDPRQFERLLQKLLVHGGFEQGEVTKYSQDGGIDLNARPGQAFWPVRQLLVQLQAKRWMHTVGRKEVAELRGSLQVHASGCVVTTSHFSRAALKEAGEAGKQPIGLVDGHELARMVIASGIQILDAA